MRKEGSTLSCNGQNILTNGNFTSGFHRWHVKKAHLVANPVAEGDVSVAMGPGGLIHQVVKGPFSWKCAYYLRFRVMNHSPQAGARVVANVAYLGRNNRLLGQTPLTVDPPYKEPKQFFSYFTIVPPPPPATQNMVVAFSVKSGFVMVDYISVAAHAIEMKMEAEESSVD
jgi:hypothetical protein